MPRYKRKKGFWGFGSSKRQIRRYDDFDSESVRLNHFEISSDTKRGIFIIIIFAIAALSVLALLGQSGGFFTGMKYILALGFGSLKFLFPIILAIWAYILLRNDKYKIKLINYAGAVILILGLTGMWHIKYGIWEIFDRAQEGIGGGYLGVVLSWPLLTYMNFWGGLVVCVALFLVGLLLCFEMSVHGLMWPVKVAKFMAELFKKYRAWRKEKKASRELAQLSYQNEEVEEENFDPQMAAQSTEEALDEPEETGDDPKFLTKSISEADGQLVPEEPEMYKPKKFGKKIDLPFDLVSSKAGKPTSGDIKNNQEIIRKTLSNFGIPVEMGLVNVGPTVTQYTLRPADGIKLSRITNLNSDMALALAAHPIRIEAPIPGKALVGIEIPNQMAAKVTMGELLLSKEFKERTSGLAIALGKDVSGKPCFANLEKMPHLLVAGATGSGKSVCINSIIVSLLYQNSPDELKFILVDPKRVELTVYNKIPYLLTPVITDVKKTVQALKWAVVEMERRFELLSKVGQRNIAGFNSSHKGDKLPYIVIIIDELADLMASASSDIEGGIVRLAQMARAVGIHLILATQRPSVEVITGLIKANIPARISFAVSSLIDSRTILDSSGAEKLVGRGDMLYLGPEVSRPKRIQGVFLSDKEIFNVINYIKQYGEADYIEEIENRSGTSGGSSGGFGDDDGDSLLGEVKEIIAQSGKASASLLQRRLKIGYARAARILDLLEDQGVIGPADGAKPREVFLDKLSRNVNPVQFAAREYNLEGELRPIADDGEMDILEEEKEEPSFTAFDRVDNIEEENEAYEELEHEHVEEIEEILEDEQAGDDKITEEVTPQDEETFSSAITDKPGILGQEDEILDQAQDDNEIIDKEMEDLDDEISFQHNELEVDKEEVEETSKSDSKKTQNKSKYFDDGQWS
ncbi:MAG: DNA translocase FtsK 4TM domain-containing protein [Candidatus Buchananbacteria bacterium]